MENPVDLSTKTSKKTEQIIIGVLLLLTTILSVINLLGIIRKYSVNLIYWDQIDFLYPIFTKANVWTLFTWQHGPHRQGLGELLIWLGGDISQWNSRMDSYIIGLLLLMCTFLAIGIKYKYIGRLQWIDILIPVIIMTQKQWEQLVLGPNISHSILPLFLVFCISALYFIRYDLLRVSLQLFFAFLCTFTGFGIFAGSVLLASYLIEMINFLMRKNVTKIFPFLFGVEGVIVIYGIFYYNYTLNPAVDCFGFDWKNIVQYPIFMSWMIAKFFGVSTISTGQFPVWIGGFGIIGMITITIHLTIKLTSKVDNKNYRLYQTIFFLLVFSLEFMLFTAIGRICLGVQAGLSSRYMTLLVPGIFAIILWLGSKHYTARASTLIFILAALLFTPSSFLFQQNDYMFISNYTKAKIKWRTCYVASHNIEYCNEATNFSIYPTISERLIFEMDYLKTHHYNLFRENN